MFSIPFFATSLLVILVPGTGVIYTVSTGIALGKRAGIVAALGCALGIVPHLAASILGLSAFLQMGSAAFRFLKLAGAAYLAYLAWSMWRSTGSLGFDGVPAERSGTAIVVRAVLINVLNPKLTLFFFAFLPQFLSPGAASPFGEMLSLGAMFMAMTAAVFMGYGLLAASVRSLIVERPRVVRNVNRSFAGLLAIFALRLAVASDE